MALADKNPQLLQQAETIMKLFFSLSTDERLRSCVPRRSAAGRAGDEGDCPKQSFA